MSWVFEQPIKPQVRGVCEYKWLEPLLPPEEPLPELDEDDEDEALPEPLLLFLPDLLPELPV